MYIYCADTWCDECGNAIAESLTAQGETDDGDSDGFPQWAPDDEEVDSPDHCASHGACLDPIDLQAWGLRPGATLHGAETAKIGALLSDNLTEYGVSYLREMLAERPRTDYQKALHRFWREAFADCLS